MQHKTEYELFMERQVERGINVEAVKDKLKAQHIELPSWGFSNSGTRFAVFAQPGAARNVYEKLADAAQVHKYTGICPTVAIHIPWDKVDDYGGLAAYAEELGIRIGAVNPNVFQEDEYKLGSICNPDSAVRRKALDHMLECIEIAKVVGSKILSLWFADGTNYPGQDSFRARKRRMEEALGEVYQALPDDMRMLIEYKFFEPAFYHTDLGDWGMAYLMASRLGPRAQVLVDLGHHPLGTNIEQIVALLLDEGKLGGFHFNNHKFADDDLTVGSINPYEMFLIYNELVAAEDDPETAECAKNVAYMIDQSHNLKPKIEAMIQSVVNVQVTYAKSLLVRRDLLKSAQVEGRIVDAEECLLDAYRTDVRPLLRQVRLEMGLDPDPIGAFRSSGYMEKVIAERGTVAAAGAGFEGA